jgi:hypothetical protein
MLLVRSCLLLVAMLVSSLTMALADCQCIANGKVYHHGELACLKLPSGNQLARCDMVLNNSAWKKVSDGCPQAELSVPSEPQSLHGSSHAPNFPETGSPGHNLMDEKG